MAGGEAKPPARVLGAVEATDPSHLVELHAEYEAVDVVRYFKTKLIGEAKIVSAIQKDRTISEFVRKKALELATTGRLMPESRPKGTVVPHYAMQPAPAPPPDPLTVFGLTVRTAHDSSTEFDFIRGIIWPRRIAAGDWKFVFRAIVSS